MEVHEVEVTIAPDGQVRLQVHGVKGSGCLELTASLEAALGGQVEVRRMTAEADEQTAASDVEERIRRGAG